MKTTHLRGTLALTFNIAIGAAFAYSAQQQAAMLRTSGMMADAANKFIASLTNEQKAKALSKFDDPSRDDWEFFPRSRKGLPLKEMTPEQRALAHRFLQTGLSNYGYLKATAIMAHENVLGALEESQGIRPPFRRDEELYFFAIFGTPSNAAPWGWRIEGHHVSLHYTLVNGELVSNTPLGFGVSPAAVRQGPRTGLRLLAQEEDRGRELITSLDEKQRRIAVFDDTITPGDLVTMSKIKVEPLKPAGIGYATLTAPQRDLLLRLMEEYLDRMPEDVAKDRREKIQTAGHNSLYFGWAGSTEPGKAHYYRVQGKTFVLEYDNSQTGANHIHSAWRDFEGDFGRDWLREHLQGVPHGR
jgi:hypothetical protein